MVGTTYSASSVVQGYADVEVRHHLSSVSIVQDGQVVHIPMDLVQAIAADMLGAV